MNPIIPPVATLASAASNLEALSSNPGPIADGGLSSTPGSSDGRRVRPRLPDADARSGVRAQVFLRGSDDSVISVDDGEAAHGKDASSVSGASGQRVGVSVTANITTTLPPPPPFSRMAPQNTLDSPASSTLSSRIPPSGGQRQDQFSNVSRRIQPFPSLVPVPIKAAETRPSFPLKLELKANIVPTPESAFRAYRSSPRTSKRGSMHVYGAYLIWTQAVLPHALPDAPARAPLD